MIALRPASGAALPTRLVWGNDVYLIPRHDRLFVGATVAREGFDTAITDTAADWLATQATSLISTLSQWDIVEHWAGLRPGLRTTCLSWARPRFPAFFSPAGNIATASFLLRPLRMLCGVSSWNAGPCRISAALIPNALPDAGLRRGIGFVNETMRGGGVPEFCVKWFTYFWGSALRCFL